MKKVIELIRVSTEQQAGKDKAGLPAQREACRRIARRYELEIGWTFQIIDVSGGAVNQAPEIREMLRLMESPDVHGVVTKEFSRLIRPDDFTDYTLLQQFRNTRTILYLADGPIDFATKSGRLFGTIRAGMAGYERSDIVERTGDAKEAMRRAGRHPNGPITLPYGVAYTKKDGWSYTPEIEKVKQMFALFGSGTVGYAEIGRRLDLPRPNVACILRNRIYVGDRVYDERRDPSPAGYVARPGGRQGYRKKIKRAPEEIIRVQVLDDGLISQEDFQAVQQLIRIKSERRQRARAEAPNRYVYNGHLTCGDCGSLVYTHSAAQDSYVCKSHNPREKRKRAGRGLSPCTNRYMLRHKLEPRIDELLGEKLTAPDFLAAVVEEYNDAAQRSAPTSRIDAQAVRAKLNALSEKKQRILDGFFEGAIGREERDRRLGDVSRDEAVYRNLLLESVPEPRPAALDLDTVRTLIEPLAEWEFLERADRRALLATLCPEICVYRYTVKSLKLNLVPAPALVGTRPATRGRHCFAVALDRPRGPGHATPATPRAFPCVPRPRCSLYWSLRSGSHRWSESGPAPRRPCRRAFHLRSERPCRRGPSLHRRAAHSTSPTCPM